MILFALTTVSWAASPESYKIHFSTYALRPLDTANLYYQNAPESYTELTFRKKSRSDLHQATIQTSDAALRIFRKRDLPNGSEEYLPAGLTKVPQDKTQWLLLLTDNPKQPGMVRAYVIEDSSTNFPKGSIRVANVTGVETIGKINTTAVNISNGATSQAFQTGVKETVDISVAAKGDSRYHLLYKNTIRITSGSRGLLILTPPIRKGSIRIGGHLLLESPNEVKDAPPL
ncbi:MAG: hypothetical protein ACPGES_01895 [Coraliomargarita sp.]